MKILIIKLGALGDVVRTLPIAEALKKKYPNSEITWLTKQNALELFENHPFVNKAFSIPFITQNKFDILYNFDIDEEATNLAIQIEADKKYGFYSDGGYPMAFNIPAEYYLNTLFDDELKKTNEKTYQKMMFEAAELPFGKERPIIYLSQGDIDYAQNFVKKNQINIKKLIGIHMGSGKRWPSKAWSTEKIKEFIIKAKERCYEILLFAGPEEVEKQHSLLKELKDNNVKIYTNDPNNTIKQFSALVNLCQKMICSDSFSLHISLAMQKPTIGLFFCTTPHEVEGYGLLKKLITPLFDKFFPEKQDQFSKELINSISTEDVLSILGEYTERTK